MREDLRYRALLYDVAMVENGDLIADLFDHTHLMGNHDDGDAHFAVDVLDERKHRAGGLWIKRTGCLVAEQDFRIGRERTRDGNALLLSAGKLGGISICLVGKPDQF